MENLQNPITPPKPLKRAKEKILALRDSDSSLDLSNINLESADLQKILENYSLTQKLLNLTNLDLSNNIIKEIPKKIKYLAELKYLNLNNNKITAIPAKIGSLAKLTFLGLNNNRIAGLPEEIWDLPNLKELHLSDNLITEIPAEIKYLNNLKELHLSDNLITEIPAEIKYLNNLKELHLSKNLIREIPAEIKYLAELEYLNLNNNQIAELPEEIWDLPNLKYLDLNNNQIIEIPEYVLSKFNHWMQLDIIENPLDIETINYLQAIGIINADTQDQQEYEDTLSQGDNLKTLANPAKKKAKQDNNLDIGNITAEYAVECFADNNKPAKDIKPITSECTQTSSFCLQ